MGTDGGSGINFAKIGNWHSLVAIIVGYSIVEIALRATNQNGVYSILALIILGVLAALIIRTNKKPSTASIDYSRGAEACLKEFMEDTADKMNQLPKQEDRDFYKRMHGEIKSRLATAQRYLKELRENKSG